MKEFKITNLKNKLLNVVEGADLKNPSAVIINIHGIGCHFQKIDYYEDNFSDRDELFYPINIKIYGLEFHGHGKSEGLKCSIDNFDELVDDVYCLVKYVRDKFKNIPIFFIAESMGGAVVIKYNVKYQLETNISGYVLLSPMCGIDDNLKPNPILINILLKLSKYYPTLQFLNTTDKIKDSCKNEKYLIAKENCEYFYYEKVRLNTARECYYSNLWIEKYGHLFNAPIYLLHGLDDLVTNPEFSIDFWIKVKNKEKKIYLPRNTNHSLLIGINEYDDHPRIVWQKIVKWILSLIDTNYKN